MISGMRSVIVLAGTSGHPAIDRSASQAPAVDRSLPRYSAFAKGELAFAIGLPKHYNA
jgi:hypothetical protein